MNLLSPLPDANAAERVDALLIKPGLRIERIVSQGQASPPGFWYNQAEGEWVLLLAGAARLRFAEESEARLLRPGDWLDIAPHRRHRRLDRPRSTHHLARGVLSVDPPP